MFSNIYSSNHKGKITKVTQNNTDMYTKDSSQPTFKMQNNNLEHDLYQTIFNSVYVLNFNMKLFSILNFVTKRRMYMQPISKYSLLWLLNSQCICGKKNHDTWCWYQLFPYHHDKFVDGYKSPVSSMMTDNLVLQRDFCVFCPINLFQNLLKYQCSKLQW